MYFQCVDGYNENICNYSDVVITHYNGKGHQKHNNWIKILL
jgi:hypothetical protein